MSNKQIYLLPFRPAANQRAHFSLYTTEDALPGSGLLIHVVGAPMAGFQLEVRESYNLAQTRQLYTTVVWERFPAKIQNFLAPVDGTMEFVQLLVQHQLLSVDALSIVQSRRDPPSHGVGLRPVAR
ncbi:hypothetical protein K431DRAFT_319683 [Polychaeton citri CBS 116435]|uniref:Uncharacterized protein n=1 Tax=Polychaeton citri CBS 116435 TaxID=1314669 RepID=A0A9P4UR72_9PEZI|nr:hypothetical protein K431DRAFT_319683 [Polychaeton citri CBS 116435]